MFDKISYYDEKNIWYILPWKTLMQLIVITKECLFQEGDLSNIIQIQTELKLKIKMVYCS